MVSIFSNRLSDDEPFAFAEKYSELVNFVENSLDIYKVRFYTHFHAVLCYAIMDVISV